MIPTLDAAVTVGPVSLSAAVRVDDARWETADPVAIAEMVLAAVSASDAASDGTASCEILYTDDDTLADLNRRFRGKDGPTNVLAFPSGERCGPTAPCFLGSIAIAFGRTSQEARGQGIPLTHHATHLTLHGLLHLLGYDHEARAERMAMERQEITILAGLGIPNPYEGS
jgi:probable rRNA maturation factor